MVLDSLTHEESRTEPYPEDLVCHRSHRCRRTPEWDCPSSPNGWLRPASARPSRTVPAPAILPSGRLICPGNAGTRLADRSARNGTHHGEGSQGVRTRLATGDARGTLFGRGNE